MKSEESQKPTKRDIIFLIIFIPLSFLIFAYLINHPIGEGSIDTYIVFVLYEDDQENYQGELAKCPTDVIPDSPFLIKFYNLTIGKDYFVTFANGQTELFYPSNETQIKVIMMATLKENWCHFGSNNQILIRIIVQKPDIC